MEIHSPQGSKPKMTSTVNLSSTTVPPTESDIKLSAALDSVQLENHGHCADNKGMDVTHVAPQDELTSAKQSYLSLISGDAPVNSHEKLHLHECCDITTRTVPVCKRLVEYGKGLSEYNDRNLKKHKNNSYPGYGGLGPLLPSASNLNLKQSASTVPLTRVDTELSHVESLDQVKNHGPCSTDIKNTDVIYQAPQDQPTSANQSSYPENYGHPTFLQSPLLVTDKAISHEIFHLDGNSTIAMKTTHASKRNLEQNGISEYTDGILKKRQKYSCTEHEVIIPDHLQVTNTECVGLSSHSFGSGAFSGLLPHKATDSNVELSVLEECAMLNQMYARDENQGMALHSATNGILDVKMGTNKENDNTPSVSVQEILDSSGLQYDVTSLSSNTYSNVSTSKVQFTVKLAGYSLSSQENLGNTTVQQLLESSCRKIGINTPDIYGVLCGKTLFLKDLLSAYPIFQDSTIDFRHRFRGGAWMETYKEKFSVRIDVLFDFVTLPEDLVNTSDGKMYVSEAELSGYSRFNLKELFVSLTGYHRAGRSFDGRFDKKDICYRHGKVYIRHRYNLVEFTRESCKRDYCTIRSIIRKTFIAPNGGYPEYFRQLLDYLDRCPAGHLSNTEVAISFLVNHPGIQFFMDRCKQSMLLDNLLHRVFGNDRTTILDALGDLLQWEEKLLDCPAMYDCLYSGLVDGQPDINPAFTDDPMGYIHYSNIFFKHASNAFTLEQLEAAHSFNSGHHLALILERISVNLLGANYDTFRKRNPEFFHLLRNDLSDEFYGQKQSRVFPSALLSTLERLCFAAHRDGVPGTLEEEQACRSLLVLFSSAFSACLLQFPVLFLDDVEKSGLFRWERDSVIKQSSA